MLAPLSRYLQQSRFAQCSRIRLFSSVDEFRKAVNALQNKNNTPVSEVSNDTKLKLYGLFKQAEAGDCNGSRPGMFDPVGRAKYDSWKQLSGTSKEQARTQYIASVTDIFGGKLPETVTSEFASASKPDNTDAPISGYSPRSLFDIAVPKQSPATELSTISYVSDSVTRISRLDLNRPKKGNSFNIPMWEDMREAWSRIASDAGVRAVVLSGTGSNFSTGMDLSVFVDFQSVLSKESCEGRKRETIGRFIDYLQEAISGPENCRVPVIAAVHGQCIGGAIDLICAADLRYCTKDTVFCVKETDLAIVADIGTLQRLPKIIGMQKAAELTYTARNFNGIEAESMGLVVKCFDNEEEMKNHVNKVAAEIASKSPITIRGVKQTLLFARDHSVKESLHQVKQWNSAHLLSNDLVEASMAIMEKRTPVFKDN